MSVSRRDFLTRTLTGTALLASGVPVLAQANAAATAPYADGFSVHVFSKMLHWLNYQDLAAFVREAGFDGVDLTVRPKGHVVPERVTEDLPKAVEAIRQAGLDVRMITTAITGADEPHAEAIIRTAGSLGIKHYRMGWINYDNKIPIQENLKVITKRLEKLAALNARHKIIAEYQNHSGENFGSPVWDLYSVLQKINSPWLGSQYDIYHATVEGANAWPIGLELLKPYIRTIDIKDFVCAMRDGVSGRRDVPLGSGNVNFARFFETIKKAGIAVPLSLHIEYDLGGAESGATQTTMSRSDIMARMKADIATLRQFLV